MVKKYRAKRLRKLFIREWLQELGVTQAELARRMDTSQTNINRWLAQPHRITLDVLSGMEEALALDAGHLFRHPATVARERDALAAIETLRDTLPIQ